MRTLENWLEAYGESHQNPTNKLVHWICVPAIFYSIIGLLCSLPFPFAEKSIWFNWASVIAIPALWFYFSLSKMMFLAFAAIMSFCIVLSLRLLDAGVMLWALCLSIFTAAWIGQFWGHHIEGKKPSFFQDLQFLLIGPAWLLHFIFRKLGIRY